jgi:hypothetical protein
MADYALVTRQPVSGPVVRPGRPHVAPITWLDLISLVMDRLFPIPGTRSRFGLNSLFLVLPILGDLIPTLISVAILAVGLSNYRVPRIVAARMVLNSLLDAGLGWIPVLGDLFDLYFKADTRNVRLLQEYAGRAGSAPRPTWRHWLFVAGPLTLVVLLLALMALGAVSLVQWIIRAGS